MGLAAGELPDQPGFHSAEQQFAPLCTLSCAGDIFQQPVQLGAGEVGVDHQTGLGPEGVGQALFLQAVAVLTGSAALPDNGMVNGFAGGFIPDNGGFTLIGDADGGNVRCGDIEICHGLLCNLQLGGPDFQSVMLDPTGLGEVLGEFLLGNGTHLARFIKQNAAVRGSTRVQCHNVLCHCVIPPLLCWFVLFGFHTEPNVLLSV